MSSTEASGSGDIARSLELLWGTGSRPSRGPKPALTLDRIVTAAVALADAEGIAAVSMRRLSTELGTGTMSLYRYVPGKAELLDLMLDRVQGEPLETAAAAEREAAGQDWRAAVDSMAREQLALIRRHPWLLGINRARTVLGPSALRGLEAAVGPLSAMGLSDPEMISVILTVESFVTGTARREFEAAEAVRETGLSDESFWGSQEPYLVRAMESGEFPLLAALSPDTFDAEFDHFEFGLARLIAGFESLVTERRAGK
ncbi:TetR/AcrR family transcriptional regulator [Streptomyces triticagri]|uniref:TetR/AcrR family transcriptional regulator n=1 Tax=Streptomyces triticagri TaxID=2293568 RepID=A0A372LY30_9ACTN|nr:TetR/AcrR family transcriptional regulator [Streptomyces triticagri]RFU83449.1 TetR/AcrR family transcriptional regulator [Streptomyces triticagri]